jgi:DNA-binding PadR family transcriptional regulator
MWAKTEQLCTIIDSAREMSEDQLEDNIEQRTAHELTAFQQNILTVLSREPQYGLAIKGELEAYYDSEVNHGRLYPNLDDLVDRGLVSKSEFDKRTNQYELTEEGYDLLLGEIDWQLSKAATDEERANDIRSLLK